MIPDRGLLYNTTYRHENVCPAASMSWIIRTRALTGIVVGDNNFWRGDGVRNRTARLQVQKYYTISWEFIY